jgi:hypothetical protein
MPIKQIYLSRIAGCGSRARGLRPWLHVRVSRNPRWHSTIRRCLIVAVGAMGSALLLRLPADLKQKAERRPAQPMTLPPVRGTSSLVRSTGGLVSSIVRLRG